MSSQRNTILTYLVDTLLPGITTGNGYNFTVNKVERGLRSLDQLTDSDFPALFVASADETRENVTHRDFISLMTVYIYGYVSQSTSSLTVQVQLDKLIEDLTKVLYQDPTQGGRATWMDIKSVLTDEGDLMAHAIFKMEVQFRYKNAGVSP